jgi:hypothetical protein
MWSAGIEPATRRVSDGRSPLSYDHGQSGSAEWARLDSNQRLLVCWTSALNQSELLARGWRKKNPGQGLEPRSPHSECGVLPARRSRNVFRFVHVTFGRKPNDVVQATRLPFGPGSHARGNRAASYVEGIWSRALLPLRKFAGKSSGLFSSEFSLREAQRGLSLLGGASSRNGGFSSWASLLCCRWNLVGKRRRRPVGSPSLKAGCG